MIESLKHIDWDKFHFLRPDYLWVAIPMAIILLLGVFAYSENNRWKKNIAKHLQPYVIQKGTEWKSRIVHLSLFFLFGFAFIAFLGPTWEEEKQPSKKLKSQLVIALDLSQSMLTTDISPTRLERAKFKIRDFLEANPRAETALKVFTASTHTVVPFTTDYKIILDHLDGLKPSMMPNKGTGFDNLFTHLDSIFVNNQAEGKILLITDDLEGLDVQNVSAFMQQNNVVLNVYPFSTKTGGNVPSFRNSKYALKVGGKEVLTALNTDVLQNLKTIENVHAIDLTLDKSDVTLLAKEISNNLIFEEKPDDEDENWKDNGYWLLIPILIVFLFSFRKGWAIYTIVLMIGFTSCGKMKENKDQNNFSLLKNTLLLQIGLRKFEKASILSSNALEIFPAQSFIYLLNGVANNGLQQSDLAIESLEAGVDYLLDDELQERDFYKQLSIAYTQKGNMEKANLYTKKALEIKDPN